MHIITGSKGKLVEYQAFFPEIESLALDLAEIQDLDEVKIQEYKVQEALKHVQGDFLIDDVSFYMDCIPGLPGPLIKWFNQSIKPRGLYDLALKYHNFGAKAKCTISYIDFAGKVHNFAGEVDGKLVPARSDSGFGFDIVFQPDGSDKTYAEMNSQEKNLISHRGRALAKLKDYLDQIV